MSILNFTDNLSIPSGRFIKWTDPNLTIRNIIGLDTTSNLNINAGNGNININNSNGNTFLNYGNFILPNSQLGVGISGTSNMISNIVLPLNGWIGLNSTQGAHTGYLGLAGSSSLLNTTGSRILLWGIDSVQPGNLDLYSGNSVGNIQLYSGNDQVRLQVLGNGTTNFQPNGSTIRISITDPVTTITNTLVLSNTSQSNSPTSGSLLVDGGIGVLGNVYVGGTLSISQASGNLNFNNTEPSTSYSSGTFFLSGGLGLECSAPAISQYNGGGLSVAGGLALGQNAFFGGNITIVDSSVSINANTGSGIFNGGVGISGQLNIKSGQTSQIKLTPMITGSETSIYFGSQNNYSSTNSWTIGQNVNNVGTGLLNIYSYNSGNFITLDSINNYINLEMQINASNLLQFNNNTINDFITLTNTLGNVDWSLGRLLTNENFTISRFTNGNFINYLLSADSQTGNITVFGTENSTSTVSGGSLTILGGSSVQKDLYIGGNIYGGNLQFSGSIVTNTSSDENVLSYLTLLATDSAINPTSGALVSFGGITIQCYTDATSTTCGGSFLTLGGGSFGKSVFIGNTVNSDTIICGNAFINWSTIGNLLVTNLNTQNASMTNLISTFQTIGTIIASNITVSNLVSTNNSFSNIISTNVISTNEIVVNSTINNLIASIGTFSNLISTNIIGFNSTINNVIITNGLTSNNINVTSLNANGNTNTLGNLFTTGGNVGINTVTPAFNLDVNGSVRISNGNLLIGNGYSLNANNTSNFVYSGTTIPNYSLMWYNQYGYLSSYSGLEFFTNSLPRVTIQQNGNVGINNVSPSYLLDIAGTFRTTSTIGINTSEVNITNTTGSINFSSDVALSNSSRNTLIFSQAGISTPTFTTRSIGTKIVVYPSIDSLDLDYALGVESNNLWFSSNNGFKFYNNSTICSLQISSSLTSINNSLNISNTIAIGSTINSFSTTSGSATFSGGIGIKKDVYIGGNIFQANSVSGTMNNLYLNNTNIAIGIGSGGNLTVLGGCAISQNAFIGTQLGIGCSNVQQTLELSPINYTSSQTGGLRISTKNPVSFTDSSYRYIDLRLVSDISSNFRGSIVGTLNGGTSTEYEYMSFSQNGYTNVYSIISFNNTTTSINSSTGSVLVSGGVALNSGVNATSLTCGGALTVNGGTSISGDLYVGGTLHYTTLGNGSNSFTMLSLTSTQLSSNSSTGALVSYGGISINETTDSINASVGNGLTVAGGVSIAKTLYVGNSINTLNINSTFGNFINSTIGTLYSNLVGINNTSPQAPLHVIGTTLFDNGTSNLAIVPKNTGIYLESTSTVYFTNYIDTFLTINTNGNILVGNNTISNSSTSGALISNGGISISCTVDASSTTCGGALTVAGGAAIQKELYVGGTISSSSDRRLKRNIRTIENTLDKIESIKPVKYNKLDDTKDYYGVIAQDFEEHFPELLHKENENAFYSLMYDRITVINMACIKELHQELKNMKNEIKELKTQLHLGSSF